MEFIKDKHRDREETAIKIDYHNEEIDEENESFNEKKKQLLDKLNYYKSILKKLGVKTETKREEKQLTEEKEDNKLHGDNNNQNNISTLSNIRINTNDLITESDNIPPNNEIHPINKVHSQAHQILSNYKISANSNKSRVSDN